MSLKNILLGTLLLFLITLEVLIALDYLAQEQDNRDKRVKVYQTLIDLQNEIGYVGLIHNFKNYLLRPSEGVYREKAFTNFQQAKRQIDTLEMMGADLLGELNMQETKNMISAYKERLSILDDLLVENLSARQLDKQVRFNDLPSRNEIENVFHQFAVALDARSESLLYNGLRIGSVVLIALIATMILIIISLFKEQKRALHESNAINVELEKNKQKIERAQFVLLNSLRDLEIEKKAVFRLNEQLTNKNKEMEQFIYTVSHDLKSPLVTISGFANRLYAELSETITEKQKHRLQRIIENTHNMESLLSDLLELSKIVQQPIEITTVDVKQIVAEQSMVLEKVISECDAVINVDKNLHVINANERLLSEIVLNLLSNAIRYREPKRQLVIDIYTTQTKENTSLHVKDNGIGIDQKYHELVFDIFERLTKNEGTGVGLTIVRTIMDKHNGQVTLESSLDQGCCFSLVFPNKRAKKIVKGEYLRIT